MGYGDEEVTVGLTFKVKAYASREAAIQALKNALTKTDILGLEEFREMTEDVVIDEGLEPA